VSNLKKKMEEIELKEKSLTNQIIEDFINSLKEVEEFDEKMIEDLNNVATKKHLSSENSVEDVINPNKQIFNEDSRAGNK
jgi:hypothetical protein